LFCTVGTLEEIVYSRQLYKQQQANVAIENAQEPRYFDGMLLLTQQQVEVGVGVGGWGGDLSLFFRQEKTSFAQIIQKTTEYQCKHMQMAELDYLGRTRWLLGSDKPCQELIIYFTIALAANASCAAIAPPPKTKKCLRYM